MHESLEDVKENQAGTDDDALWWVGCQYLSTIPGTKSLVFVLWTQLFCDRVRCGEEKALAAPSIADQGTADQGEEHEHKRGLLMMKTFA